MLVIAILLFAVLSALDEVVEQSETARGCKKTTECCFSPSVTDPKGDVWG